MALFELKGLTKGFGGLIAVDKFDMVLERGDLTAIIGPNGAGKTTLFNLITKHLIPDSGEIFFKEENITHLSSPQICQKGVGRSFQRTNVFPTLTVFQNVQVSVVSSQKKNSSLFFPVKKMFNEEVFKILENIGLSGQAEIMARNLSHGDQRRLEVGITLALKPELLLLDEPTSGMAPPERFGMINLIKNLAGHLGLTLLFIEHDMDIVFAAAQRILVMHEGRLIAEGRPEEIRGNEKVRSIYLGET